MKSYTITQEQILALVEHLAILSDSNIKNKKQFLSFADAILEHLELDKIVKDELEYLKESKSNY